MTKAMCKCGQYLIGETRTQNGQPECEACYQKRMARFTDMDNPNLAIKCVFECRWQGDPETVYLPYSYLAAEYAIEFDTVAESLPVVLNKLNLLDYGYKNVDLLSAELVDLREEVDPDTNDLVVLTHPTNCIKCQETNFWIYFELAYVQELKHRPFDNLTEERFACNIFWQCYCGEIYSKDFRFVYCEHCETYVCEQNPSNGWMVQVHEDDEGNVECNKCYETRVSEFGINDDFDGKTIPGQFFSDVETRAAGWRVIKEAMMVASGYEGYRDPQDAISVIKGIIDSGKLCLVSYDSMAIGGLGGYVSIYAKETANV